MSTDLGIKIHLERKIIKLITQRSVNKLITVRNFANTIWVSIEHTTSCTMNRKSLSDHTDLIGPYAYQWRSIHPQSRVVQPLRIEVDIATNTTC